MHRCATYRNSNDAPHASWSRCTSLSLSEHRHQLRHVANDSWVNCTRPLHNCTRPPQAHHNLFIYTMWYISVQHSLNLLFEILLYLKAMTHHLEVEGILTTVFHTVHLMHLSIYCRWQHFVNMRTWPVARLYEPDEHRGLTFVPLSPGSPSKPSTPGSP